MSLAEKPNCPLCNDTGEQRYWEGRWRDEYARAERLRLELEKIGWMDEFLDAAGARAMMNIARDAVNADESTDKSADLLRGTEG